MKTILKSLCTVLAFTILSGCASYSWTSEVPEELRTISVPSFENRTMVSELGTITTQFILREFQREGTFKIKRTGDAALEVQGVIVTAGRDSIAYNRSYGTRASEYRYFVVAEVSVINKKTGRVLFEKRNYVAETTFLTQNDILTAQRNSAQRIATDLARQIVDDIIAYPYEAAEDSAAEDKKAEDKKAEDKKAEDKKAEDKKPQEEEKKQ